MKNLKFPAIAVAIALVCLSIPQPAAAGWEEGVAAFRAGNMSSAINEFKAVTDAQPDWPGGHYMLGWSYLRDAKHQEAIAHLRKAYELTPANVEYQLRLGEAYVKAGRYKDAVGFLSKIDGSKLTGQPKALLLQLNAVALTKTGQSREALAAWKQVADNNPRDGSAQLQYGTLAYNEGNTQDAINALKKAVALDPKSANAASALVKAYNKRGRETRGAAKVETYKQGAAAAEKLVALGATYDNLMLLGEAQLGAKLYNDAISSFQTAAGKNSRDWLPHFYEGQAHTAVEKYASAEKSLRQALDKTTSASDKTKIWSQLGFVYEKQKKYENALSAYREANNSAGITRVEENMKTAEYNKEVEAEARRLEALAEEEERLRQELKDLKGGGGR